MISGTVLPAVRSFRICFTFSGTSWSLRPNLTPRSLAFSVLGFLDAVHLPLVPYVVLKLGDQREDAQDEFASARGRVDGRIVRDLEASRSLTFRTSRRLWALASPSLTRMVFGAQLGRCLNVRSITPRS